MDLPDPVPGLVLRYGFLWSTEARLGREIGRKDRPCAVVLASRREAGITLVAVAPITHTRPSDPTEAIPLSPATKRRLELDDAPSWIIASELNRFIWPGPDLLPVETRQGPAWTYGLLPFAVTRELILLVADLHRRDRVTLVPRPD